MFQCNNVIVFTLCMYRKYHKVLKGIAPIHFDKNSTETHVKGCIHAPPSHIISLYTTECNVYRQTVNNVIDWVRF